MNLITRLRECTSIQEALPILSRLNAGPAVRKLVETAIILSNSDDPQQKDHAYGFMNTAIQELNRNGGSEQSSDSVEPYTNPAKTSQNGHNSMVDMQGTQNQMNGGQMMKQIQYTVNKAMEDYFKKEVLPLQELILHQRRIIKNISAKITEAKRNRNSLDLAIKETKSLPISTQASIQMDKQRIPVGSELHTENGRLIDVRPHKEPSLEQIRHEIMNEDKRLQHSPYA